MIWKREEYIAHSLFQFTGKEMFCELFGPIVGLDKEWQSQGATTDEINLTAFHWDYVLKTFVAGNCKPISGISPCITEDTPDYTFGIDEYGRKTKMSKKCATLPLPQTYPVSTKEQLKSR